MGRKTKLTKTVQEFVCAAIERGANVEMRCHNGSISKPTYHAWLKRAEDARILEESGQPVPQEEQRYLDFLYAIEASTAVYAFTLQQVIADAAERDPAEARRELQRLFPNDYAPPAVRQQISGPDGGPVAFRDDTLTGLSDDDLRRNLAALGRVAALVALESGEPGDGDADGLAGADSTGEGE